MLNRRLTPALLLAMLLAPAACLAASSVSDTTSLAIYRIVLDTARAGRFEEGKLDEPLQLARRPHRISQPRRPVHDMPENFAAAFDALSDSAVAVDLDEFASAGVVIADTLDRSGTRCNAMFSTVGYNRGRDAAAVMLTYGCRDSAESAVSILTFLTLSNGEWQIVKYMEVGTTQLGRASIRLREGGYGDAWQVEEEAAVAAREFLKSPAFPIAAARVDLVFDSTETLRLGRGFNIYGISLPHFLTLTDAGHSDPRMYAGGKRRVIFPLLQGDTLAGEIELMTDPRMLPFGVQATTRIATSAEYKVVVVKRPIGPLSTAGHAKFRKHANVARLLGVIQTEGFANWTGWAYVDTAGTFKLEEATVRSGWIKDSEYVVIGELREHEIDAISLVNNTVAYSSEFPWQHKRDFDIAAIDVDDVLKGNTYYTRFRVYYERSSVSGEIYLQPGPPLRTGDNRAIFFLNTESMMLMNRYQLTAILPIHQLDAVRSYITEPPPLSVKHTATRGAEWSADLTGKKGETVFFVLGMLDEHTGRHFIEDGDRVERFYRHEADLVPVFERYLKKLNSQQGLHADFRTESNSRGASVIYSKDMNAFLSSFYDYTFTGAGGVLTDEGRKMATAATLPYEAFSGVGRNAKLAYLAGAYFRYGAGEGSNIANIGEKGWIILRLLDDVGCEVIEVDSARGQNRPRPNAIRFVPTEELHKWFDKMP